MRRRSKRRAEASISPKPDHSGGLSKAQQRLAGLLEELTATVESAEHLTRMGEPEEALRIVEQQRKSLFESVDSISRNVGTKPARFKNVRRRLPVLVAAVAITVAGVALSVGAMTNASDIREARIHLQQAARIQDPSARLRAIYVVYNQTAREHPEAVAAGTAINAVAKTAVVESKSDLQDDPENASLVDQAQAWIDDIAAGEPMTPPAPSPNPSPAPTPSPSVTPTPAPTAPSSPDDVAGQLPPLK